MVDFNVLGLSDYIRWNQFLQKLHQEQKDIYFTPDYYKLFQELGDGTAQCFVFKNNNDIILYPFLLNSINLLGYNLDHEYYDIQGAYGYNGYCTSSTDSEFIKKFYSCFKQYCIEKNIIAEFFRFHPLLKEHNILTDVMNVIHDRDTVMIDLQKPYSMIWEKEYSSKNRNMIRKAQSLGYKIQICKKPTVQQIESFIRIYNYSMDAVKSEKYYYFNHDYFVNTFGYLKEYALLFNVLNFEEEVMCSSIFFHYGDFFHYHLSGRSAKADNSVNNFLIDQALVYAQEKGAKVLHLGGGRSRAKDDSLLKFKNSFSTRMLPFYIGKKIHNEEIYNEIVHQWALKYPEKIERYNNFLLKYRY